MENEYTVVALRKEMLDLLRQQITALNSPQGLTDEQLMDCYRRQIRVQDLREKLQAASLVQCEVDPVIVSQASTVSSSI